MSSSKVLKLDFTVADEGSIFLLQPLTEAGTEWIAENLLEDRQTFGTAVVVEHSYIVSILEGIMADGLIVRNVR
jgi:hypothetical protein